MSTTTENLNLFKYDPIQDAKSTFNIQQCLNDNWDKIDQILDCLYCIGEPIFTLTTILKDNEIWLEGAEVSKTDYPNLYTIYGDTYGTAVDTNNFVLPDFRNRVIWGATDFGYIDAGLPNITGSFVSRTNSNVSGCFKSTYYKEQQAYWAGVNNDAHYTKFLDASLSSEIYGNSETVQPPAIKIRVKTRYM